MNEKNYEFLKEQLTKTGFGDKLHIELANKLSEQPDKFTLSLETKYDKDSTLSTLHFSKGSQSDMYFFNRYEMQLKTDQGEELKRQLFYVNKVGTVTQKEGYNLLNGRSVYKELSTKEGERYHAWMQLDLKNADEKGNYAMQKFNDNYGFDLKGELSKFGALGVIDPKQNERIEKSLQKGNLLEVLLGDLAEKAVIYLAADPAYKSIKITDQKGDRLRLDELSKLVPKVELKESQKQKQSQKQNQKQQIA